MDVKCVLPSFQRIVSMAVNSDGSYGIEKDLCYSFPVKTKCGGEYEIVQGLDIDDFQRGMMDTTAKELIEEKELAMKCCMEGDN